MSTFLQDSRNLQADRYEIDFDDAIRLPDGGSTCDIYRTKWHRHEVFVKRLKEEYRTNPLYLDALDKEYEIGVNLKHPSLPDYREFHRDYIVMDYIDGTTLSDMIKCQDPWLKNEKNIIRVLKELVEVTDYLHRHNVTHCDIKPDNIMITANNKNLVLIDFDKCYTDSLNDTSGDPSKYGLTVKEPGKIAIDFNGIAQVTEKLKEQIPGFQFCKYKEFIRECYNTDVSPDKLLDILHNNHASSNRKFYWSITLAPFFVALIFGCVLWLYQGSDTSYETHDGVINIPSTSKDSVEGASAESSDKSLREAKTPAVPTPKSQEQMLQEAQQMAIRLDKRIKPMYDELNSRLDKVIEDYYRGDYDKEQLVSGIDRLLDLEMEYGTETFEILKEMYPGISERQEWRILAYSRVYTGYKRGLSAFLKKLEDEEKLENEH